MTTQPTMKHAALLALAAVATSLFPQPAAGGNWVAKNVLDLIAAINAADAAGGVNTITLAPDKTFTLTTVNNTADGPNGLPVIVANNKLTIRGDGTTIMRSKAAGTPAFRLFDVASGASLTLENLTLANGLVVGDTGIDACGGAILNSAGATLTVKCSIFLNNQALGGDGGGGPGGLGLGGAVWNDGTAIFDYVLFRGNQAMGGASTNPEEVMIGAGSAFGGAISSRNDGKLTVKNCWFTGNKALGGRLHQPSLYMLDGMGSSGAIDNLNTALVSDSTFTDNQVVGGPADPGVDGGYGVAGAIASGSPYASTTVISILRCTFTRNQAIGGDAGPDGIGGVACDGAVGNGYAQVASTLTIAHCTFADNQAIGGNGSIGGQGQWGAVGSESPVNSGFSTTATIANCLFANNKALGTGPGGAGLVGAVGNSDWLGDDGSGATLAISDCTFIGNEARGATGDAGASPAPELVQRAMEGLGCWSYGQSGAVDSLGNLKILRCTFRNNRAIGGTLLSGITPGFNTVSQGGGLSSLGGSLEVRDSSFVGNQVIGSTGSTEVPSSSGGIAMGGGIMIDNGLAATIANCGFWDNAVKGGAGGGSAPGGAGVGAGLSVGLYPLPGYYPVGSSSAVTISGTTISRNQAVGGAGGGQGLGGGYAVGTGILFGIPDVSTITLTGGSVVNHNQPDNVFQF